MPVKRLFSEIITPERWMLLGILVLAAWLRLGWSGINHLYLPDSETPFAVHDIYTSSRAWQHGDHLITRADFETPPTTPAYFHAGMYSGVWGERYKKTGHLISGGLPVHKGTGTVRDLREGTVPWA
jgi:hypothetical protein